MSPPHPNFFPQHPIRKTLTSPAKALLFGEYGVLYGGQAVVLTFTKYRFTIDFSLTPKENQNKRAHVCVESAFFASGGISFECGAAAEGEVRFFVNALKPWETALQGYDLHIAVRESYASALGFGSSSAILALVYTFLWECFFPQEPLSTSPKLTQLVHLGLQCVQNGGSAYDIFCQMAAMAPTKQHQLWSYSMVGETLAQRVQPLFVPLETLQKFGSFLQTSIYSDTALALQRFSQSERKYDFAQGHKAIAGQFLQDISLKNLEASMRASHALASAQGLFLPAAEKSYFHGQPYKTMGAGYGDCLWVLADKKTLIEQCAIAPSEVAFAFEELQ